MKTSQLATWQRRLEWLTHQWWFYGGVLVLFFLPAYASTPFDPRETPELVKTVLSHSLVYSAVPTMMWPIFKIAPMVLIAGVLWFGRRMGRWLALYAAVNFALVAVLQHMALTTSYGFVVITGNLVVYSVVALVWLWEAVVQENDWRVPHEPWGRVWVVPLAIFAFWLPVNPVTFGPTFNPWYLVANDAGLAFCMMTPVYLALLVRYFPRVNMATLRVTAFAGFVTGLFNMVMWFGAYQEFWWIGVVHLPLVLISLYAFALGWRAETVSPRAEVLAGAA